MMGWKPSAAMHSAPWGWLPTAALYRALPVCTASIVKLVMREQERDDNNGGCSCMRFGVSGALAAAE